VLFDPARTIINVANIGVVSVLLVVLALRSASDRRWLAFAVLLGLALAIKPVAGALVLLPLLERKTRIALLAAAIPVSLSAVALAMSSHPAEFFTDKVPLLLHGYPEYTWTYGSLHGVLGELSVPSVLVTLARVLLGAALALTAVRRYRAGGDRGLCVAETAGCLVVATLLCSTISLNHYALFALPLLVGITRRESALRSFAGSVGLLLIASPDRWTFLTDLDRGEETAIWATGILMVAASLAWNQLRSARVADRVEPTATPDAEPALANR
jgi:arabinofuranan 3-O-arabinosyltransferase